MPLPFGLKLKRTRRYTVSSKSCLVARIQLLNNEFVEFTLSVESTGQESLEAVAQRLELREDSQGSDIFVGACLDGIFVKHKNGRPPVLFRWHDIANMSHNKSFFTLELTNKEETIQFQTVSDVVVNYITAKSVFLFYYLPLLHRQAQTVTMNPVRRRSSSRLSLQPKPQPYMMTPAPPQLHYNGHYGEPYTSSQDNLYGNSQNGYYCHSQTSLDRAPHDYNGRIRNGSVYSAHSTSSLNNPQHYMQPSPMSSNPSITSSDVLRSDYVPSHRHSALIPPSYRPTPDYETVMKHLNRGGMIHSDKQSHSMRNLNIGNSYAYSRPDALVYSQPEIREQANYTSPHSGHYPFNMNYSFHSQAPYPYPAERRLVVGAVSVPELTNVQLQAQEYPAPNIMKTQVYRLLLLILIRDQLTAPRICPDTFISAAAILISSPGGSITPSRRFRRTACPLPIPSRK
ncbi:hypothetical protein JRQ81_001039 [Phrynocephalus forsythii]|uniref:FERM C-terminal PH-like domain-containing protein n=1 Tax=Phrynocephalus forsythii TaxID=171643 RepID=A0A9Q1B8N5_9SAUR|nr:hypothetical protein JRQ81_001039 [Phrynocephalus forsythii]